MKLKQIYTQKKFHQKVGKGYEHTLLKRRHLCGQKTWKKAHHHRSLEKCKSKLQWDTISCQLEYLIIKKSGDNRCWRGCGEIEMLSHCWWECKLVQTLWNIVWWFLKDLWSEIPFDPANSLLGTYPKDCKVFYYKDKCTYIFIAVLFTIAKTWNQPKCPAIMDHMKHIWQIYTMEY